MLLWKYTIWSSVLWVLYQCSHFVKTQSFHLATSPVSPTPVFTFCENTIFPSSHQSCGCYISVLVKTQSFHPVISPVSPTPVLFQKHPIFPSSHQSCESYTSVHTLWKHTILHLAPAINNRQNTSTQCTTSPTLPVTHMLAIQRELGVLVHHTLRVLHEGIWWLCTPPVVHVTILVKHAPCKTNHLKYSSAERQLVLQTLT